MKRSIWHQNYQILREELLKLRKEKNLTQVELSKKLNKPQSYVSKYEIGDRNIDVIELIAICHACQIHPTIFFKNLNYRIEKVK